MKIVGINDVRPSAYNPREADPKRLEIVALSLKKLGFLLPLYADADGELLSGHQRHHVASTLGFKEVPVVFLGKMPLNKRKAINIAFNRGTNDFSHSTGTNEIKQFLLEQDLLEMSKGMPDLDVFNGSHEDLFPCMKILEVETVRITKANTGAWVPYARNMARMLSGLGVDMPVVVGPDLKIVNGVGRVQYCAEKKIPKTKVILINDLKAKFASVMLNYLSMDFDLHNRYRDYLRHNSFRRARRVRSELGKGFIHWISPGKPCKDYDITLPGERKKWILRHGKSIVDFGAGHLHETNILRSIGVNVSPFEPYRCVGDEINKAESIKCAKAFLDDIASGKLFSSVFISSVLNSVPFAEDRRHIASICAALCSKNTRLYACATGIDHVNIRQVSGYESLNERQSTGLTFKLDYEEGITVADIAEAPKVQKYHSGKEFYSLFKEFFQKVAVTARDQNVYAECSSPLRINAEKLRKSIDFEFNLPYPDGTKMGLVDDAILAFEKRLGIKL